MRTKYPSDKSEENIIKRSKENDGLRNVMGNLCGQVFGSQKFSETHIRRKNHVQIEDHENHDDMYCFKFFSAPRELDTHMREMHSFPAKDLEPNLGKFFYYNCSWTNSI